MIINVGMAMMQDKSPNIIYHYTDGAGLIGIMKDQALWATDYRYLNDKSELSVMHPYMKKRLEELPYNQSDKNEINKIMDGLPKIIGSFDDNPEHPKFFITSFCKDGDLLSQWRGYGPDGGYAIGFDYAALHDLLEKERGERKFLYGYLGAVVYDDDVMPASFRDHIDEMIDNFRNFNKKSEAEKSSAVSKYIVNLPFLKHNGFSEESEYRWVFMTGPAFPLKDIRFRYKGGMAVPYVELFANEDTKVSLSIKKIVVGPSRDRELRKQAIQLMLAQKCLTPQMVSDVRLSNCIRSS